MIRSTVDPDARVCDTRIELTPADEAPFSEEHRQYFHRADEIRAALADSGFEVTAVRDESRAAVVALSAACAAVSASSSALLVTGSPQEESVSLAEPHSFVASSLRKKIRDGGGNSEQKNELLHDLPFVTSLRSSIDPIAMPIDAKPC